jgi:hypothetical protein
VRDDDRTISLRYLLLRLLPLLLAIDVWWCQHLVSLSGAQRWLAALHISQQAGRSTSTWLSSRVLLCVVVVRRRGPELWFFLDCCRQPTPTLADETN